MLCIVMEYASGGDLASRIEKHRSKGTNFPEKEIWHFFIQIVRGLKALHDMQIFHRDIKAANIYLTSENVAKLGDMNVSKIAKAGMVYTQTGTPYYASPEVWKDLPYNGKSDIWSLGCVLYEMCALRPPFMGESMKDLYRKVIKGEYNRIPSMYSFDLGSMIKSLLQVNPMQRPTCDQILETAGVKTNLGETLKKLEPPKSTPGHLLSTIKVPLNFKAINQHLPKPNYNPPNFRNIHSSHNLDPINRPQKPFERLGTPRIPEARKKEDLKEMKPQLAQRGAVQILRPAKIPDYNLEESKKPPLIPSIIPSPIIFPPKIPNPPLGYKPPLPKEPGLGTPRKVVVASNAIPETRGKENQDTTDNKQKVYDLYVRKHYNVPIVKLQPNPVQSSVKDLIGINYNIAHAKHY